VTQLTGMVAVFHTTSFLILRIPSLKFLYFVPTLILVSTLKVWRKKRKSLQFLRSKKEDVFEICDEVGRFMYDTSNLMLNTTVLRFMVVEGSVLHTLNRDTP
jgi:hypothetical protein